MDGGPIPILITSGHAKILGLLDRLNDGAEREELVWLAEEIEILLQEHFSDEEGRDGLFPTILKEHPGHRTEIEALCTEHRDILAALEVLVREAARRPMNVEGLGRALRHLDQSIRAHERRETALLNEVFNPPGLAARA